ncbi:MAG: GDP-mannose 4,6-dehydratase [Deltaproteobacteria bacterium]|nr:GDP-mannose 4,6-dehydratase [Deltaproteobacteria bacterium]
MKKALITGIAGFVGSHLAERLKGRYEVSGALLGNDPGCVKGVDGLNLVHCDLLDKEAVSELVGRTSPDVVFHLAALSAPSISFKAPSRTLEVNIFSTLNLFESVYAYAPEARVLNIGSGDEYGDADELPVTETAELRPLSPYAVSKVTQDLLAYQYWRSRGLNIVRCRPFNHYGPRQSDLFVCSAFARQIAEIEAGLKAEKTLSVGNIEAAKDFLDVSDVVSAYEILIERGVPGAVYNVCSGRATRIREIVEGLISLSTVRIDVVQDPERFRPADVKAVYGDATRLKALGWAPERGLEEGLKALLDFWRSRVAEGKPL